MRAAAFELNALDFEAPRNAIRQLRLADFRNYASLSLNVQPGVTVITGSNGAGKTNLLESVSLLAPGRGLRRSALNQLARTNSLGAWAIHAIIDTPDGEVSLGTGMVADSKMHIGSGRKVRINGNKASITDLETVLAVLWLTPAMDGLFTGPASDRRRFLDRLTASFEMGHTKRIHDHEQLVKSRNRLLSEPHVDATLLGIIEAQIAEHAVAIAYSRVALTNALTQEIANASLGEGLFPTARLGLIGSLEESIIAGEALSMVEDAYRDRLQQSRFQDQAAGRTLEGVHRSDLSVIMAKNDMPAVLGSTGQQKALLISIMMAEAALTHKVRGTAPILLLDEVAAHLDGLRRAALFDHLITLGGQVWLTGTDTSAFESLGYQAHWLNVHDAVVEPIHHETAIK